MAKRLNALICPVVLPDFEEAANATQKRSQNPKVSSSQTVGTGRRDVDGRDEYLGAFGSEASRSEYKRIIAEWLAQGKISSRHRGPVRDEPNQAIVELILH